MGLRDGGLEILGEAECIHLIHTVEIGRVAITLGATPVVLPVNFTMSGSEILFFTGPGLKLSTADEHRVVSFEADDFDVKARTGWSVLAVGRLTRAEPGERARVEAMGVFPWAAGDRSKLLRIRPTFWSGRRILTG